MFGSLLGRRPNPEAVLPYMVEATAEADRVYRNLIELHGREVASTLVDGPGLYKARLHSAVIVAYAFSLKWPKAQAEFLELLNVATGLALEPLAMPGNDVRLSRDEVSLFALDYAKRVLLALRDELLSGPSLPTHETDGLRQLVALYHEALADSIGPTRYGETERSRLDHLVTSGVFATVRRTVEVASVL